MTNIEQHVELIQQANKITKRKTIYAAGAGLIPFPIIDTATLLGVQLTMIKSIGNLYDIPFKKHVAKSLIGSLIGSITSVGLVKLIPGLGTILGGAAAAATGAASTYALGRVFTQHFDQGGTLLDFDPISSREYFQKEYEAGQIFVGQQNLVEPEEIEDVSSVDTKKEKQKLIEESKELQAVLVKMQQDINFLQGQQAAQSEDKVLSTTASSSSDLTIIEGIGPKTEEVLKEAGIQNLAALAYANVKQLKGILKASDGKFTLNPTTWPEQAALAAAGDLAGLKALQEQLFGGKHKN